MSDAVNNLDPTPTIRMLAVDLDGTLLTSAKQVDQATASALRTLAGRMPVVIASARPPRSVRAIYQGLGLTTPQVNYNGALIWDETTRSPLFHLPMPAALSSQIIAVARDHFDEVEVSCEILDQHYTDAPNPAFKTETGKLFKPDVVSALEKFAHLDVTKILLMGEPWMMLKLEVLIEEHFSDRVSVIRTDDDLIQIMDKRSSKAVAVERVARQFGLEMTQVMAIGDAPNDYAMVGAAGVGVAMGNAHSIVKDVARWTAPRNDEQGVLAALRHFGLL